MNPSHSRIRAALDRARSTFGISPLLGWLILLLPWPILITFAVLLALPSTVVTTRELLRENRPVELVTFAGFLVAGVLGIRLAWRAGGRGLPRGVRRFYGVAGILFVILGFEEISWGQWLFGFETPPGLRELNIQHEFNVHNLPGFDDVVEYLVLGAGLAGLLGASGWFARRAPNIRVPFLLIPWFLAIVVATGLDILTYHVTLGDRMNELLVWLAEVVEMLLGLSTLLYIWLNARMLTGPWESTRFGGPGP